jgi:hypothetical protein
MDEEIQTNDNQEAETTEPQKRNRRKSIRRRLDERLQQLDSLSRNPDLKPTKQAEAAIEATSIEKMLFQAEREDRQDASLQENERLKVQHEQDVTKIAELETAKAKQTVVQLSDPETPKLKQQVKELTALIAFVASERPDVHAKACTAIRAIVKYGTSSRVLVESLGFDLPFYYHGLLSNPTVDDLQSSLSRCSDPDGIPAVYARACLEVLHGVRVPKPVPRVRGSNSRDFASLAEAEFND